MKDGDEMISISLTDPATLPQRDPGQAKPSGTGGPFAKSAPSGVSQASPKAFQPQTGKSVSASYDDLEDLDNLFNGLDDK